MSTRLIDIGSFVYHLILHVFINFVNIIKSLTIVCSTTVASLQNNVSIVSPLGADKGLMFETSPSMSGAY